MSYKTEQYKVQSEFFKGKCGGIFGRSPHSFVLAGQYRHLNLNSTIYDDATAYFRENRIQWWRGKEKGITNHTLSSQIACINHLFWLMHNQAAATSVLQAIDQGYTAIPFNTGNYIEFEYNGSELNHGKNILGETGVIRGSQSTSLDACMLAECNAQRIIIGIEWKYVETYNEKVEQAIKKLNYAVRKAIYRDMLIHPSTPIHVNTEDFDSSYARYAVEPFYQLMRQTLWGWRFSQLGLLGTSGYRHVHIIPNENTSLLTCKTSPEITRDNLCEGWRNCLREPNQYIHLSPRQFVEPIALRFDPDLADYLRNRYWRNSV